jgi:serine/threonine protein kinase
MPHEARDEESIFTQAVELTSAEERDAFLKEACGEDHGLRQRVEALLRRNDETHGMLDSPPPGLKVNSDPAPDTQIGPYKLLEQIGEGGMGVVYLAEQLEPVHRRVALKIIKPGMDTRHVIGRFEAERQALALMEHPHIAKVHDAGTTDSGRPYFVMELVEGVPVTKYCDDEHLTVNQRLELFIPICQAVQHAHLKGIIHRDLKPSNILVSVSDGQAVPKVIDFGVAKAIGQPQTEETTFTRDGQIVGTLEYMSPEQANLNQLDVDTRSDIYSLGVVLYELLVGATPFARARLRSAAFDEMMRIIREEDFPRPSMRLSIIDTAPSVAANRSIEPHKLSATVHGELDWIVMKALEKDRARRYETATAFADDVRRYLNDEAVAAGPPSKVYRLRKLVRRNKAVITAAALILLTLLVGVVTTSWQAIRATQARADEEIQRKEAERQRDDAEEQRGRAERQEKIAQENFERARDAVDRYLTKVSEEELLNNPGLQPLRKDLLELALEYYQEFIAERSDDPKLQADLAAAYFRAGMITSEIGSKEEALNAHLQALSIQSKITKENPNAIHRRRLAVSYIRVGDLQMDLGRREEASLSVQKAIDYSAKDPESKGPLAQGYGLLGRLQQTIGDRDDAIASHQKGIEILEDLAAATPEVLGNRAELANAYTNAGNLQKELGQYGEAIEFFQKSIAINDELVAQHPNISGYQSNLAIALSHLGSVQSFTQLNDAQATYKKVLVIWERLTSQNPTVSLYKHGLANVYHNLGCLQATLGENVEASAYYRKAIEVREELVTENPNELLQKSFLSKHYEMLSRSQASTGKLDEALASCQQAKEIRKKLLQENSDVLGYLGALVDTYNTMGRLQAALGQVEDASNSFVRSIEICEELASKNSHVAHNLHCAAVSYHSLGDLQRATGKADEATISYQKAIDIHKKLVEEDPTTAHNWVCLANHYNNLGTLQLTNGKNADASISLQGAIEVYEKLADEHPDIAEYRYSLAGIYGNLGSLQTTTGKHDQAMASQRQVLAIRKKLADEYPVHPGHQADFIECSNNLAWSLVTCPDPSVRDPAEAVTLATKAVEHAPENGGYWNTLGVAQFRADNFSEAVQALNKSIELTDGGSGHDFCFLAMAHWQLGEKEEARRWYDKAIEWMGQNAAADEELKRFRAEAAQLLGIVEEPEKEKPKQAPDDKNEPEASAEKPENNGEPKKE